MAKISFIRHFLDKKIDENGNYLFERKEKAAEK